MQTPTTPHQHPRHDPVPLCMAKKWLPVSHRHGCAIYAHQNLSTEQQGVVGGELMVSAIIKGTPQQCLAALNSSSSSTCGNSILGPTTAVEVLSQSADGSSEVLCIHLAQPCSSSSTTTTTSSSSSSRKQARISRLLARLCCRLLLRRRCAVVQQTTWQDPLGIHCLTFASLTHVEQQQQHIPDLQQHTADNCIQIMRSGSSSAAGLNSHTPHNGHCCPETGPDSQHRQQQQQYPHQHHQHHQHQQQQQQQLRHRGVSAPGSSADKQQGVSQQVQLHACCHQHSSGDGSSGSTHCQPQQQHQQQQQPLHALHQHQQHQQQQQQQRQQPAPGVHLLLQPLYLLLRWLGSLLSLLASLLGLTSSSSGSSRLRWGLLGPVHVSVVGGFTVAGLDSGADSGADNGGCVSETLVTSILKVDLGGCLATGSSGGCSLLHSAAVRLGVVDALVGQMLSAVERVKATVEHPTPASPQQQQQQGRVRPVQAHIPGVLQGLMSSISAVVGSALAPLTAWQVQRPQQQQQQRRQHSGPHHRHQQQQTAARGSSSSSSQGGTLDGCLAAAAVVSSSRGPGALVSDIVGLDKQGQPLTGFCSPAYWSPLHQPGYPTLFQVRGPHYLADRAKVSAGDSAYALLAVDLVSTPTAVHHLARFLPSVRRCRAASAFVINMMVPAATDVMNLVMTFGSSRPWPAQHRSSHGSSSTGSNGSSGGGGSGGGERSDGGGSNGSSSSSGSGSDSGFQNALRRFLQADDKERSNMFKMIPHIEVGPWVLQGMVGTTPVIMGRKLETSYFTTDRYVEVDIDVTTCRTAGFIVQSIRGATTSLVVDLCYLLEGHSPQELPEQLIGAVRFSNIDMAATTQLDLSSEVPSWPQPW